MNKLILLALSASLAASPPARAQQPDSVPELQALRPHLALCLQHVTGQLARQATLESQQFEPEWAVSCEAIRSRFLKLQAAVKVEQDKLAEDSVHKAAKGLLGK